MLVDSSGGAWGGVSGGVAGSSLSLSEQPAMLQLARQGRRGQYPPPFLTKLYAMVDDPDSNSIITWSLSGTSFIVKDFLSLAADILPRNFKHNNFSSFVYQLNNYGFRKIGLEQWEYQNEWFQQGKKHLLGNIMRRNQRERVIKRRQSRKRKFDAADYETEEAELDSFRNKLELYKVEAEKLKQQQISMQNKISGLKDHMEMTGSYSQKLISFLAHAYGEEDLKEVIRRMGEGRKGKENEPFSSTSDSSRPIQFKEINAATPDSDDPKGSQDRAFWMRLWKENSPHATEADEHESARRQFMIDMELDDMIASKIALEVENGDRQPDLVTGEEEDAALQLWT